MFLRLPLRETGSHSLFNVDHILRVDPGASEGDGTKGWCRILHLPVTIAEDGSEQLTATEIGVDIDRMSMFLSGKWIKDPM